MKSQHNVINGVSHYYKSWIIQPWNDRAKLSEKSHGLKSMRIFKPMELKWVT